MHVYMSYIVPIVLLPFRFYLQREFQLRHRHKRRCFAMKHPSAEAHRNLFLPSQ